MHDRLPPPIPVVDLDWPRLLHNARTLGVNVYRLDANGHGHVITVPPTGEAS